MEQEVNTTLPAREDPLKVFDRMEQNRKLEQGMDVSAFLSDIETLDQAGITKIPDLLDHLRDIGKEGIIWGTLFDRLSEADQKNDQPAVKRDIRLAELLGMEELPEMPKFLADLRNKYFLEPPKKSVWGRFGSLFRKPAGEKKEASGSESETDQNTFGVLMLMGREANGRGNRAEAYRLFSGAIAIDPNSEEAHLWAAATADDEKLALAHLEQALRVNPATSPAPMTTETRSNKAELPAATEEIMKQETSIPPPTEEPAAEPDKPVEQPTIPVINQLWQEAFPGPAEKIGDGYFSDVYRPASDPTKVIKVLKPGYAGDQAFQAETAAYARLQGSKYLPALLGMQESPAQKYLVKEYCDGEDVGETLMYADPFPIQGSQPATPEQRKLAAWFVSSMEALAEFYEKGVTVTDFRTDDWRWDAKANCTKLIDLGNAWTVESLKKQNVVGSGPEQAETALKTEHLKDINRILSIFFALTTLGQSEGMIFYDRSGGEIPKWPNGKEYLDSGEGRKLLGKMQSNNGVDTLKAIIVIHAGAFENNERIQSAPTARAYIQHLKDYFQEVGIDISQTPAAKTSED